MAKADRGRRGRVIGVAVLAVLAVPLLPSSLLTSSHVPTASGQPGSPKATPTENGPDGATLEASSGEASRSETNSGTSAATSAGPESKPEVLVDDTPDTPSTPKALAAGSADGPEPSEFDVPVPDVVGPRFTVLPFENRSGVVRLNWLGPAAAFIAGELSSSHRGVRPAFGPTVVPRGEVTLATPDVIASYASTQQADFVITGSFSRPNWKLELAVELWKVSGGGATRVGVVVNQGD